MQIGVYHCRSTVDFSGVSDYLKELLKGFEEQQEKKEGKRRPRYAFERMHSRLIETLEELDKTSTSDEGFFRSLVTTYAEFGRLDTFPKEVGDLFFDTVQLTIGGKPVPSRMRRRRPVLAWMDYHTDSQVKDAVFVERRHLKDATWLFDVTTVKEDGLLAFRSRMCCIPPIKDKMKTLREKKQHSSRYAWRPYALATQLWLTDDASISVLDDLRSFLLGAVRYILSHEWRTSIVLSAITVESVLADLYEEAYKSPAPDTPLGALFRQVKGKIDFPPEIVTAINMTNESRIAAVHRSRYPVSDREATNALYGAVNVVMWHFS